MAIGRATDLSVVGINDIVGEDEERGAGVGNGTDRGAGEGGAAYTVAVAGEAPEALAVVYRGVGDVAGIGTVIDEAELIGARGAFLEVRSEEGRVKQAFRVGEECLLLVRSDRVDGTECESQQAIALRNNRC